MLLYQDKDSVMQRVKDLNRSLLCGSVYVAQNDEQFRVEAFRSRHSVIQAKKLNNGLWIDVNSDASVTIYGKGHTITETAYM
jgi:hypothetical protein